MIILVKDFAHPHVAVRISGDAGQNKGGTQQSTDRVYSQYHRTANLEDVVRPPGFEPGLRPWKGRIITRLDYGRCVFSSTKGVDLRLLESQRIQSDSS